MEITNINGQKWVLQLEWEMLPNEEPLKKELTFAAEKAKKNLGVVVENEGVFVVGLTEKRPSGKIAMEYLALSNQEAIANDPEGAKDWIVVEPLAEDSFWMGVTKNGLPAPGYDVVDTLQGTKDKLFDLLQGGGYKLFSTADEIRYFVEGTIDVDSIGLLELTSNLKKKAKGVRQIRGISSQAIIGIIVAAILVGGGLFAVSLLNDATEKDKLRLLQLKKQKEAEKKRIEEEKIKQWELTKQKAMLEVLIPLNNVYSTNSQKLLEIYSNTILGVQFKPHGWKIDGISCENTHEEFKSNPICNLKLLKTKLSSINMLREEYPSVNFLSDTEAFVPLIENFDKESVYINHEQFNTFDDAKAKLPLFNEILSSISQIQEMASYDIKYNLDKNEREIIYKEPAKPLTDDEVKKGIPPNKPKIINTGIFEGRIEVSSTNLGALETFIQDFKFNPYMTIKKLDFNFSWKDQKWVLELAYFVKKV